MREQQANRLYYRELFAAIGLYIFILFGSNYIAEAMPANLWRKLLAISPALPALLMIWTIVRHFQRIDEYLRIWSLENMGMASAFTAVFALTYGFMETTGFPRLSMFMTWSLLMGSWALITCLRSWHERRP